MGPTNSKLIASPSRHAQNIGHSTADSGSRYWVFTVYTPVGRRWHCCRVPPSDSTHRDAAHRSRSKLKHRGWLERLREQLIAKRFNVWQALAVVIMAYLAYLLMVHFSTLPTPPASDGLG